MIKLYVCIAPHGFMLSITTNAGSKKVIGQIQEAKRLPYALGTVETYIIYHACSQKQL